MWSPAGSHRLHKVLRDGLKQVHVRLLFEVQTDQNIRTQITYCASARFSSAWRSDVRNILKLCRSAWHFSLSVPLPSLTSSSLTFLLLLFSLHVCRFTSSQDSAALLGGSAASASVQVLLAVTAAADEVIIPVATALSSWWLHALL